MRREPEVDRRLNELRAPDEDAAEARAWEVVSTAYAERTPAPRPPRARRVAVALAAAVAVLALGLTPAGAAVADLVRSVIGTEAGDPEPSLTRLPAAGEMLVTSTEGPWVVRDDGSKRLLGDYEAADAVWSQPRSLYVAIAAGDELVVADPGGEVRWSLARATGVADPRWSPSGFRVAYRSGRQLRLVAGDGTGDRRLARRVAAVAPAWSPATDSKLMPEGEHVLAYARSRSLVTIVDADSRRVVRRIRVPAGEAIDAIDYAAGGSLLIAATTDSLRGIDTTTGRAAWRLPARTASFAPSPDGGRIAAVVNPPGPDGESRLVLVDALTGEARRLPAGIGRFGDVAWSPDGRWLVLGWTAADQWLFLRVRGDRPGRVIAVGGISRQFAPGSGAEARFPGIAGWAFTDPP